WDERYTTAPAELAKTAAERNKATEAAFKDALSPQQLDRAKQLAVRVVVTARAGFPGTGGKGDVTSIAPATLTRYPELADALKLTDEQRKLLTGGTTGRTKGGTT